MNTLKIPRMYIFAGNNGSGKSTIRNETVNKLGLSINIDVDEIERRMRSDGIKNPRKKSAIEAINLVKESIENKRSFSIETTLTSNLIKKQIKKAKSNDFKIIMYYIFTNDVFLNIYRIKSRFEKGGHTIPTKDVFRRHLRSKEKLIEIFPELDHFTLIDNSDNPQIILEYNKEIDELKVQGQIPEWIKEATDGLQN